MPQVFIVDIIGERGIHTAHDGLAADGDDQAHPNPAMQACALQHDNGNAPCDNEENNEECGMRE